LLFAPGQDEANTADNKSNSYL